MLPSVPLFLNLFHFLLLDTSRSLPCTCLCCRASEVCSAPPVGGAWHHTWGSNVSLTMSCFSWNFSKTTCWRIKGKKAKMLDAAWKLYIWWHDRFVCIALPTHQWCWWAARQGSCSSKRDDRVPGSEGWVAWRVRSQVTLQRGGWNKNLQESDKRRRVLCSPPRLVGVFPNINL